MNQNRLDGITLNGVPLSDPDNIPDEKTSSEVKEILSQATGKQSIYRHTKPKYSTKQNKKGGPVMSIPLRQVHRKNEDTYLEQAAAKNNLKHALVSLLLCKPHLEINDETVNLINDYWETPVKKRQLLSHMAAIMRTALSSIIVKEKIGMRFVYHITEANKNIADLPDALVLLSKKTKTRKGAKPTRETYSKAAENTQKESREIKKQQKEQQKPPKQNIFGGTVRIEHHFYFHFK